MPNDDKKPQGWNFTAVEGAVVIIFLLAILGYAVPSLINYFTSAELTFFGLKIFGFDGFFGLGSLFFKILGIAISIGAAIGAFVFTQKANLITRAMKAVLYPDNMLVASSKIEPTEEKQTSRWEKIVKLSESQNSSDWKLAIIEADIILDELLEKLQLPGETMGEKLKAVEKSDFNTIEAAWEAHKARNAIAHEGNDYLINQREVHRIISLYESIFKEFRLI